MDQLLKICLLIFCSSVLASAGESADDVKPFIVNGRDAVLGQFPYFASIRYGVTLLEHGCGGGILNTRWILTAGHCLMLGGQQLVVVGSVNVSEVGTRYNIIQSIIHPEYLPTLEHLGYNYSNWHDIGLIKVDRPIVFNSYVSPIPLVRRRVIGHVRATVAGLGAEYASILWQNLEFPEILKYMNTEIITNIECSVRSRVYGSLDPRLTTTIIYPGHICTLGQPGVRICFGDSGSPLITRDGVVGVVVSGVMLCSRNTAGGPDIYVRVSTYLDWIDSYIHDLS